MEVLNTACFCQASGKGSEAGATLAPWEIYKEHQEHCRVWGKQRMSEVEEGPGKPRVKLKVLGRQSRSLTRLELLKSWKRHKLRVVEVGRTKKIQGQVFHSKEELLADSMFSVKCTSVIISRQRHG